MDEAIVAAQKAGMSETEINRVLVYGYDIRVSTVDVIDMMDILSDARSREMPVTHLLKKIDEGVAKRVSFIVIKAVVKKKIRDYHFVLDLFTLSHDGRDKKDVSPVLLSVAESLDFGLTQEELTSIFSGLTDTTLEMWPVAANNAAFLKQLGFKSELALHIVRTGLIHKSLGTEWEFFFKSVETARKKGFSDKKIADVAVHLLVQKKNPDELFKELESKGKMAQ